MVYLTMFYLILCSCVRVFVCSCVHDLGTWDCVHVVVFVGIVFFVRVFLVIVFVASCVRGIMRSWHHVFVA